MTSPAPLDLAARNGQPAPAPPMRRSPDLAERVDRLERDLAAALARLDDLDTAQPRRRGDDPLKAKIVEWMRQYPGMALSPLVVAENIDEDNRVVGQRMNTLVNNGVLHTTKREGKTRTFWYPKAEGPA